MRMKDRYEALTRAFNLVSAERDKFRALYNELLHTVQNNKTQQIRVLKTDRTERVCDHCKNTYKPYRNTQRYCSEYCRVNGWRARNDKPTPPPNQINFGNCVQCDKKFHKYRSRDRFCRKACADTWYVANRHKRA